MIETTFLSVLAIVAMGVVTLLPRIGGFWLMERVKLTPRLRRMLEALPGSIVVAIVLPIVVQTGISGILAVGAAGAAMLLMRNELVAVGAGVAVAALVRLTALG